MGSIILKLSIRNRGDYPVVFNVPYIFSRQACLARQAFLTWNC